MAHTYPVNENVSEERKWNEIKLCYVSRSYFAYWYRNTINEKEGGEEASWFWIQLDVG